MGFESNGNTSSPASGEPTIFKALITQASGAPLTFGPDGNGNILINTTGYEISPFANGSGIVGIEFVGATLIDGKVDAFLSPYIMSSEDLGRVRYLIDMSGNGPFVTITQLNPSDVQADDLIYNQWLTVLIYP
jgi:hypothetical protein